MITHTRCLPGKLQPGLLRHSGLVQTALPIREVMETAGTGITAGDMSTMTSSIAAPVLKVSADVSATWIGRAVVVSVIGFVVCVGGERIPPIN
jgi:hypothetical protein